VEEAFAAGRPALRLLVVPQRRGPLEKLVLHATRLRIPIVELEGGSLTALAGFDGHQGVALVVEPRAFASLDDILARAADRDEPPFILVLDSLEDPQNVGTLLRSAEAAGVHGVVFPVRRQAPLTPAAVKASAGAVEHLLLCPVDDLGGALADLHGHGLRIAGSEADAPLTARQSDLRGPLAIVVGSEGQGLGPTVRRRCDLFMRIPMRGAVGSLNAAVAGSILLFEAVAQRDPEGRARTQPASAWPIPTRRTSDDAPGDAPATDAVEPAHAAMAEAGTPPEAHEAGAVEVTAEPGPAIDAEPRADDAEPPAGMASGPIEADVGTDEDLLPGAPVTTTSRPARPRKPRTPKA
jgi:23S rRNA (guanosine2251-2'-O)-methyltransferase